MSSLLFSPKIRFEKARFINFCQHGFDLSDSSSSQSLNDFFVVYLHGFLSAPESIKAQQTLQYCQQAGLGNRIAIPEVNSAPLEVMAEVSQLIEAKSDRRVVLIGSSLGGYYATYLAEKYDLQAALINPAIEPCRYRENFIGSHKNYYSDETHIVTDQHMDELQQLEVDVLKEPKNYLLLTQTGDEVLDYRVAAKKYEDSRCIIQPGGNHSFENYDTVLPLIFAFFGIRK